MGSQATARQRIWQSFSIVEHRYLRHSKTDALSTHNRYVIGHYCHGCVCILQD